MTSPFPEELLWPQELEETLHPGGEGTSRRLLALCAFVPGGRVLDAGCGRGGMLELLGRGGWQAVGVDRSPERLRCAARRGPVVEGTLEALPFDDGSFDGVVCECVLSQSADPRSILGEFFRVLRPGGVLGVGDLFLPENVPPGGGPCAGCVGGARRGEEMERSLAGAGFLLRHREDHSRAVRELAARLVWAGILSCEAWTAPFRRGYALWVSGKPNSPGPGSGQHAGRG